MKKFLTFLLLGLAASWASRGQTIVRITTGTALTPEHNAGPIYRSSASSSYDVSRFSYLYTADELAAAGINNGDVITELGWVKSNADANTGGGIFRIYMKNSAQATYGNASATWATLNANTTLVYQNLNQAIPATQSPNYIVFPLGTSFTYTGGSIEISTEWDINQVTGNPSTGPFSWMLSSVPGRIYGTAQTALSSAGTLSSTSNSINPLDNRRPYLQIGYIPAVACSGAPLGGTALSSSAAVCQSLSVTLSVTGTAPASGLSYQWQQSADGIVWSNIASATAAGYSATMTTPLAFRRRVICNAGPDTSYSTAVSVGITPFQNCYCTSGATSTADEDITNFKFAGIDNTSPTSCQTYTDYTTITGAAVQGLTYPISITTGDCEGTGFYNRKVAVFVDWNHDGDFTGTGERIYESNYQSAAVVTFTGQVAIPTSALAGTTRLRVVCVESTSSSAAVNPCGTYTKGETEDYLLNVIPPPPNEAGVLAVTKPEQAACSLGQQVWVKVQNLGSQPLTSATFTMKVNGLNIPVGPWTGNIPSQGTQDVQLPVSYAMTDGDSIYVEVSMPNGAPESPDFAFNNRASRRVYAGLSGVKTVGAASEFPNLNAAIQAIQSRGVCDTVYFKIASATYATQHTLVPYPGTGRLVVFESATGNPADVKFTFPGTAAADNFVFRFDGGDGYMLRNLTAVATGSAFATVVDIRGGADDISFVNNVFIGDTVAAYSATDFNRVVVASVGATNDLRTTLKNNRIIGGSRGINLGGAATGYETGHVVEGNTIEKFAYAGAFFGNLAGLTAKGNTIRPRANLAQEAYSIYANGIIDGADIASNVIGSGRQGTSIFLNNVKGAASEVRVTNNFLYQGDSTETGLVRGVLIQDVNTSGVVVANNSIASRNGNTASAAISIADGSQIAVYNNNVGAFGNAPALRVDKAYSIHASDRNNLFGANLANVTGTVYTTLSGLQTGTGRDIHSVSVNPGFNGTDLHTCAPALNAAGISLPYVTVDIDGEPRSATPDIGADEFVGDNGQLLVADAFLKCPAEQVTIGNESLVGVTYSWTPAGNGTASRITVSAAGTYVVTATSVCGSFSDTATVVNKPLPTASFTSTTVGLAGIFTNTSANASSYLWDFGDGQISTEFSPSHVYSSAGTYSARLTVTGECGTATFGPQPVNVINAGVSEASADIELTLFPNPTSGQYTLTLGNAGNEAFTVSVIDVTGKVLSVKNLPAGTNQITLDATAYATGIYSVKVGGPSFYKVVRLIRK